MIVSINSVVWGREVVGWFDDPYPADMARLTKPEYSKAQIVMAGKALRGEIRLGEDGIEAAIAENGMPILEAFRIAHNWRDAHMHPLLHVRRELSRNVKAVDSGAVTAARIKRMAAIRRKLKRPITLYQMQDIAGCRAVVSSIEQVDRLVAYYRSGNAAHAIQVEDDYILNPKKDGYRSHHIILKFNGDGENSVFNRQTVEIQIRTRLQHSWATAVEAVGLVRRENIKGGAGDQDWRRFFELMASELSYEEGRQLCPSALGSRDDIRREIRDLSKKIKAVSTLESYNRAIKSADDKLSNQGASYYLLQFNYETQEVSVRPFMDYEMGAAQYIEDEKQQSRNTVLVEVSKVADLRAAFPNYFLDVTEFTKKLRKAIDPKGTAKSSYDLSWLARYR